jgi:ATP/ADP translocase
LLVATLPLVQWTRSSVPTRSRAAPDTGSSPVNPFGGFSLVVRDRYLLLVALLIVLLNCVNTMGEYLLSDLVIRHADAQVAGDPSLDKGQLIGEFYADFSLAINVLTVFTQLFLVGRLFRWIGVHGALLVLPVVALLGYGLVAFVPIFGLLRVVKIFENSGNYSVMNTARQALFLPLSTDGKYEGKIATDTFFWRFGDLVPAGIVFVGLTWLDFGTQQFALVNIGLSLVWLAVAVRLAKRAPATDRGAAALARRAGARTFARGFPALALAARASSWLALGVGLIALASSAPADAAAGGAAGEAAPGLLRGVTRAAT